MKKTAYKILPYMLIISIFLSGCEYIFKPLEYFPSEKTVFLDKYKVNHYLDRQDLVELEGQTYIKAYDEILDNLGITLNKTNRGTYDLFLEKPSKHYIDLYSRDFISTGIRDKTVDIFVENKQYQGISINDALYLPISLIAEHIKSDIKNSSINIYSGIYDFDKHTRNIIDTVDHFNLYHSKKFVTDEYTVYISDKYTKIEFETGEETFTENRKNSTGYYKWDNVAYYGEFKDSSMEGAGRYVLSSGFLYNAVNFHDGVMDVENKERFNRKVLFIGTSFNDDKYLSTDEENSKLIEKVNEYFKENGEKFVFEYQGTIFTDLSSEHPNTKAKISRVNKKVLIDSIGIADKEIDFSKYDQNLDGVVSPEELTIVNVLAGSEYEWGDDKHTVLSHYATLYDLKPEYDGKYIQSYLQMGEKGSGYGILLHELGHSLGLVDLYNTKTRNDPVGKYSLMSGGYSTNPVSKMDPMSRIVLGSLNREPQKSSSTLDSSHPYAFFETDTRSIFYVAEYRDGVLIVWRINEDKFWDNYETNTVNNDRKDLAVSVQEVTSSDKKLSLPQGSLQVDFRSNCVNRDVKTWSTN